MFANEFVDVGDELVAGRKKARDFVVGVELARRFHALRERGDLVRIILRFDRTGPLGGFTNSGVRRTPGREDGPDEHHGCKNLLRRAHRSPPRVEVYVERGLGQYRLYQEQLASQILTPPWKGRSWRTKALEPLCAG